MTCIITVRDFINSTADQNWKRQEWKPGYLRHVVEAVRGLKVAVTTDKQTGHTPVGVELVGVGYVPGKTYAHLGVRYFYTEDGQEKSYVTWHDIHSIGMILPLQEDSVTLGAKWTAIDTVRAECSAATALARAEWEKIGCNYGAFHAEPLMGAGQVYVTYTPQNPPRDVSAGTRQYGTFNVLPAMKITA
jgi:hypothetical protein